MINTGTAAYFGITTGRITGLGEHHVIALGADVVKTVGFKNSDQLFIGNRAKL